MDRQPGDQRRVPMRCAKPIERRAFLKTAAMGFGAVYAMSHRLQGGDVPVEFALDRYGGWTGMAFEATGFFRTHHDGRRWWFVTPEGNAFISFGVNHYHDGWWAQAHNRDYWVSRFGAERPHDEKWNRGFREAALTDLHRMGLNTLGVHTSAPMLTEPPGRAVFPYVAVYEPLRLSHYLDPDPETYVDVFSAEFQSICDAAAREMVEPYAEDPMILGFCMADCPLLTDNEADWKNGTTWPRRLRNLGPDAPGKQAYVATMRSRYPEIAAFNLAYETAFESWDQLAGATNWRANATPANRREREDNAAFLVPCVDRYYSVARNALRRYDGNHLFLGDKLNGNTDALDGYLDVTRKYTDVVNIQYYARWAQQRDLMDRWTGRVGQPFLNGDSAFTTPTDTMPNPHGPHARDQAERAAWTLEFMENALARPDFVGWHMCGIIDTTVEMPGKKDSQHQGLMTTHGQFYPEMEQAVKDLSSRLYRIAAGA